MFATTSLLVLLLTVPAPPAVAVAMFVDEGVNGRGPAMLEKTFAALKDLRLTTVTAEDIRAGKLKDFRVLIVPGGAAPRQAAELSPAGREAIKQFVSSGGCFVGICAGCYLATSDYTWSLGLIPAKVVDKANWERGRATLRLELTSTGRDWFARTDRFVECEYHNGPVLKPDPTAKDRIITLAHYRGEIAREGAAAGLMHDTPAIIAARAGKGWAIGISPHPEQTDGLKDFIPTAIRWALTYPAE